MATVTYHVPDDIERAFDAAFRGEDKSAVIARLMRRAVEEKTRPGRRPLGLLKGKASFRLAADFALSDEEIAGE